MRADRLLSIIMLLQIHKQLTAEELSKRLEVSIRTIYRDIDVLSGLGVPISTERGSAGGIKLLGNYKTSLTGLNSNELHYLFMPTPNKLLDDLSIDKPNYSTFLKLLNNLPTAQRSEIENIQKYIYIDMDPWHNTHNVDKEIISTLQKAIGHTLVLNITYRKINEVKAVILNPLGLVCKKGIWYLIGINENIIKTYRVSSIETAYITKEIFSRPIDFNLEKYWLTSITNFKSNIPKYIITIQVNETILNRIKERNFIKISKIVEDDSNFIITIEFDAKWQSIEFVIGFGKDIIVMDPPELIDEIKEKALEVLKLYK